MQECSSKHVRFCCEASFALPSLPPRAVTAFSRALFNLPLSLGDLLFIFQLLGFNTIWYIHAQSIYWLPRDKSAGGYWYGNDQTRSLPMMGSQCTQGEPVLYVFSYWCCQLMSSLAQGEWCRGRGVLSFFAPALRSQEGTNMRGAVRLLIAAFCLETLPPRSSNASAGPWPSAGLSCWLGCQWKSPGQWGHMCRCQHAGRMASC